ncbi:MAG: aminotransferase class I/II-fold pyridoxal phosphate-dependent enzyme, partial [Eggerthellaceae bacterium]|nr:aminotransferase class I/II-fold pyridoxal phosphate-dependent enzyme [Eggerthellaceae bacterium]
GSAVRQSSGTLLFLCSPNNPTGLTIEQSLLVRILQAAQRSGAVVVLDECFLDFTREPSAVPLCERFPNLVVMRAFTKLYAMAGLRLGYGICSDAQFMKRMEEAGQLWAVSTPAQVAGVAALEEPNWAQRTREYVDAQRAALQEGLERMGLRVIPGQANYLMLQSPVELYEPMLRRGFLIRRCANYVGLDQSWYRIAVRTAQENAAFLAALQEVLA